MAFPGTLCVNGGLRAKVMTCPGVALSTTLPPRLRGWPSCALMPVPPCICRSVFRILAARGALALEDASGACGDRGPVDGPSGDDDGLHRFDDGREPAFGSHDADVVEPHADRRPEAFGRRHRHHRVAPREAGRVLHTALPVAGIRVAEPGPEPVARAEQGEQTGPGGRAVGVAVAHADGVVEHHDPGRHARPLEHLRQTPAHAFRGLARQRRHPAHVRTRERHRRETHDPLHASDHGPGPAEIDLRASRRPLRFGEAVRPRSMPLPPTPDPALHRRVRAREPAFPHKPLVHAGRGTAPLDRHAQAGGRPSVHDGRVPVINQRSARASAVRRFG